MLSGGTTFPSCTRDSTRVGHGHLDVVVGYPDGLRLPIKNKHQTSIDESGDTTIKSEGKTLIRSSGTYRAWAKKLPKAMPPTTVDEDLPQSFKAE